MAVLENCSDLVFPIQSSRLALRIMEPTDFEAMLELCTHPDICRYIRPPMSREAVVSHIADRQRPWLFHSGQWCAFAVTLRETGEIIGEVCFRVLSVPAQQAEIGFRFHPNFQGKGYAREASNAVISLLYEKLGLYKLIGICQAENQASAHLLEKLGFKREGFMRNQVENAGRLVDACYYGLLRDEWQNP